MSYIRYIDCLPGGNKTALVIDDCYDADEKKRINDVIMAADPEIEQVGFVLDTNTAAPDSGCGQTGRLKAPSVEMAGGEFCGNASRSAAYYYLNGHTGELTMTVSGGNQVRCGVTEDGGAWCEIPQSDRSSGEQILKLAPGIHRVSLSGITHLVLEPDAAAPHLKRCGGEPEKLKQEGLALIEKYGLMDEEAAGTIFLEALAGGRFRIHPVVRVRDIDSLFYETACGSGTVAAAMVMAQRSAAVGHENTISFSVDIVQPSGMSISAGVSLTQSKGGTMSVTRAVISGQIITDLTVRTLII